ncbi:DNA alkylation repair enzyme [Agrilactobacillus composti DSM 18527 = JCM 14202]|nr:DNA alkylation repair protein [Agrilactobacillus composti]GAF39820.1 DNA alkylation repair enzyme [Agrilactobacillus composti DSM 18527 = JCM 14202]
MMEFELKGDPQNAQAMAKYMRNRFAFLGVKTLVRHAAMKPLLQASRRVANEEVLTWIDDLYQRSAREYQYAAIDLATYHVKHWQFADMVTLSHYVSQKSWWDSVDSLRQLFGKYLQLHPQDKDCLFALFYRHTDFWMRRVSINLQLMQKELTDIDLLTKAIMYDLNTDEFFIQKAIGWSLRQYSKTNPQWVADFMQTHPLSPLAQREGSKYLTK